MYRDLELQETVTKQELIKYGFGFNERRGKFEFFKKLSDNIGVIFIAYAPESDDDRFINYKVKNLNTGSLYAPFYNRRYSCNNEVADRVEEWLKEEIDKMVKTGLVKCILITKIL